MRPWDLRPLVVPLAALVLACGDYGSGAGTASSTTESVDASSAGETATTDASTSTGGSGGEESGTESGSESASTTDAPTSAGATTEEPTGTTGTTTEDPTAGTTSGGLTCRGGGLGAGDHELSIEHDGMTRTLRLHVPPSYDDGVATPLVVNFHGLTSNADQQVLFSAMNPTADAEGFIVAYPNGHMNSWNAGECCGQAMSAEIDDVGFVRALVAEIEEVTCVDPARIFATGMSNGGFMTNRLACEASDLFAAFAPVSAVRVTEPCEPERPVPIMMFNGTVDSLVPYDGGLFIGAVETFEGWAAEGGCEGLPVETFAAGAATCETYEDCDAGVEVTLCTIDPMGHCWPGNAFCPFVPANTDISANESMWAFFEAHPLP